MYMIEILALENGAHNNQTYHGVLPEGWTLMEVEPEALENFPFGSFETVEVGGVLRMKADSWTAGEMPDPSPIPEPEPIPEPADSYDEMAAAIKEGVNEV